MAKANALHRVEVALALAKESLKNRKSRGFQGVLLGWSIILTTLVIVCDSESLRFTDSVTKVALWVAILFVFALLVIHRGWLNRIRLGNARDETVIHQLQTHYPYLLEEAEEAPQTSRAETEAAKALLTLNHRPDSYDQLDSEAKAEFDKNTAHRRQFAITFVLVLAVSLACVARLCSPMHQSQVDPRATNSAGADLPNNDSVAMLGMMLMIGFILGQVVSVAGREKGP
ncbi:MAG: hypothetical protein FD180_3634 [Planctomycetota bacterium]|nr:MAG: hypothetical protein FD180_3634 [Planctomycetota bacterium]